MKKFSRVFRFSLKAFLIFVVGIAVVFAWLGNAELDHRRELAAIAVIRESAADRNVLFETKRAQDLTPLLMVLR